MTMRGGGAPFLRRILYPGATIYELSDAGIQSVAYEDTDHYLITRDFLNAPERYLRRLFADDSDDLS